MNRYAVWFGRVVWIGILANFALAIPGLLAPDMLFGLFGMPAADPLMWPRFASLLLILLSVFYMPAAIDPLRNRATAWFTVYSRLAGVIFFSTQQRIYLPLGLYDGIFLIPEFILLYLAVHSKEPVTAPPVPKAGLSQRTKIAILVAGLLVFAIGIFGYYKLMYEHPAPRFASDEEHFLYGSIGTENSQGVPYWIWTVLPTLFPEYLPRAGSWASLGIPWEQGRELPVGFAKVTIGIPRVGINCAICHTATYRASPDDLPKIVASGPSHATDPQRYQRFLFACASDPRFTSTNILNAITRIYRMPWLDYQLYKFLVIPFTRQALIQQKQTFNWTLDRPNWGRGRIDPFNPIKFGILKQPIDATIGNSDMPPLWNQKDHAGYSLHWDGLNTNITEVVLTSALGDGASKEWVERDRKGAKSLARIESFIKQAQPPKYPFPVDSAKAAAGKAIYDKLCASCHAPGGARTGQVVPVEEVGTDRHRLDMWTEGAATAYNNYARDYSWKFNHFVKTKGYVNVPLEGCWLRGPYLHNGSVPSLADLMEAPGKRPTAFYRGYDVLDPVKVGFISDGADAQAAGTRFDVAQPGNSNVGHIYGTALPAADKMAVIEYLKTL